MRWKLIKLVLLWLGVSLAALMIIMILVPGSTCFLASCD
jgi:hypothetical protein